jgi:hypothetical protein
MQILRLQFLLLHVLPTLRSVHFYRSEKLFFHFGGDAVVSLIFGRFHEFSIGSCPVRDHARVRHNTSWSTDKPDLEGAPSTALPYDRLLRSLTRLSCSPSLLHCHHLRIWQSHEETPMYALYETLFRDRRGRRSRDAEGRLFTAKVKRTLCTFSLHAISSLHSSRALLAYFVHAVSLALYICYYLLGR